MFLKYFTKGKCKPLGAAIIFASTLFSGCALYSNKIRIVEGQLHPKSLVQRIEKEGVIKNNKKDKYAILITGNNEKRFVYDLWYSYYTLLENNFKKENIYLLDEDGKEKICPFSGFFKDKIKYPVDGISTADNIESLLSHLSKKIDENDLLFINISSHGNKYNYKSSKGDEEYFTISLPGLNLTNKVLKIWLDKVESDKTIILIDSCYSGGFAKTFSKGKYIGISSSKAEEVAWSKTSWSFSKSFMEAYNNKKESDKNKDGKISIQEAFEYGKEKHPYTKPGKKSHTPLLESEMDVKKISIE